MTYTVHVSRQVSEYVHLKVTASSPEEAQQKAKAMAVKLDLGWQRASGGGKKLTATVIVLPKQAVRPPS